MRKNFGSKPVCYPQPVFIIGTYDENGTPDAMNAAWGGISEENEVSICISENHKTTENILVKKAFTVSMATADYVKECDYLGIVSGYKVPDKLDVCGFHTERSQFVDAPLIDELPMALECEMISYDPETCRLVGQIVTYQTMVGSGVSAAVTLIQILVMHFIAPAVITLLISEFMRKKGWIKPGDLKLDI